MSKNKPILHRVLAVVGGVSFLGSTIFGISSLVRDSFTQPSPTNTNTVVTQQQRLEAQERGYETVLQREPQNQVALEGLVQIRLQMNNLQEAVEPLESLVKLHPERYDYQTLLAQVKQQLDEPAPTRTVP